MQLQQNNKWADYLTKTNDLNGGWQKLFKFPNGYGASVVSHNNSYGCSDGLCEIAVIKYVGDIWYICYGTEVTSDVIGYVSPEDVPGWLIKIMQLQSKN